MYYDFEKEKKSNELLMVTIWEKKLQEKNNMKKLRVYALKLLPSLSKFYGENIIKYINKK